MNAETYGCRTHTCMQNLVAGFSSGGRTTDFQVGKFLSFPLDRSVIGSDDTLFKWEAWKLPDQEVRGSIPRAKPCQIDMEESNNTAMPFAVFGDYTHMNARHTHMSYTHMSHTHMSHTWMQKLDVEEKTNIAMSFARFGNHRHEHEWIRTHTLECRDIWMQDTEMDVRPWRGADQTMHTHIHTYRLLDLDVEQSNNAPMPFAVFGDHWRLRPLFRDTVC